MQGSQKNRNKYTDHEMEDILGSIVSANEDGADGEGNNHQSQTSLFSNIANFFKKSKDDGGSEPVWQEFPWEQVIVKTDVILKWKKVDMKKVKKVPPPAQEAMNNIKFLLANRRADMGMDSPSDDDSDSDEWSV